MMDCCSSVKVSLELQSIVSLKNGPMISLHCELIHMDKQAAVKRIDSDTEWFCFDIVYQA